MRSYGQYCAIAKALDLVGDRWTLLIVRELLLSGPMRYTDLRNALPGIATNLLADRLRELSEAGIVRGGDGAPPVAAMPPPPTPRRAPAPTPPPDPRPGRTGGATARGAAPPPPVATMPASLSSRRRSASRLV